MIIRANIQYLNSKHTDQLAKALNLISAFPGGQFTYFTVMQANIIAPDKREDPIYIFFFCYFSMKMNVVGTHLKCLIEALQMSTHNIHFCREIKILYST